MIKVEDLRVGSVLQIEGQIITVGKIDEDFISWRYNIKDRSFWNPYISLKDERLKPIELTEEILLKCGFVRDGNTDYYTCRKVGFTINLSGVIGYRTCIWTNEHIKHLHQLQNLYYALTNEELKINL